MMKFGDSPQNIEDMAFQIVELEGIDIAQWHPEKDGKGKPTEVHMRLSVKEFPQFGFAVRFKGKRTLDAVISSLAMHRRDVFGVD